MATTRAVEGPWAGALLREVEARVTRGWPAGLTLFTGDDRWHLDRARQRIVGALVPEGASFGLAVLGDEKVTSARVASVARSGGGMFASRRVVLVRDLAMLDGEADKDRTDPLVAYAEAPPADSHVLIHAPRLDRKRRLHAALAAKGVLLSFRSPDSEAEAAEAVSTVESLAARARVVLAAGAALFLLDRCRGDFHRVERELDKARNWSGGTAGALTASDLAEIVHGDAATTGWELSDAVTARDREAAMAWARRLGDVRDKGDALPVLGGLAWRARTLLRAKAMLARGAREQQVIDACRAWGYRGAFLAGVRRYTLEELLAFPSRLLEADRALKGGSLGARPVLESLVHDLVAGADARGDRP